MIAWNDRTHKIVMVRPAMLKGIMYKDGPNELAGFLTAGWSETFRGDWRSYNEQMETVREMYNKKLQKKADLHKRIERVQVQEEEEDQ